MEYSHIKPHQAHEKHDPKGELSAGIRNPVVRAELNQKLGSEFNDLILHPSVGIQKIRKVLHRYGLDLPILYELRYEGDEAIIEMDQYGKPVEYFPMPQFHLDQGESEVVEFYLYLLYYLTDKGVYEFYAELVDREGLDLILKQTDITEEDLIHQD